MSHMVPLPDRPVDAPIRVQRLPEHYKGTRVVTGRCMRSTLSDDDEGKRVVTSSGDDVGMIKKVEAGRAFVDTDPGLSDSIRTMLGWGEEQEGDWEVVDDRVDRITDDEVVLKD